MAELIFDTSSEDEEFEGFTPDDVIKANQKGSELRRLNEDELSDISFDDLTINKTFKLLKKSSEKGHDL
jgi:hypothetical protein